MEAILEWSHLMSLVYCYLSCLTACLNDNYTLHEIALRSGIEMMELNKRKAEGSIMENMIYSRDKSSSH